MRATSVVLALVLVSATACNGSSSDAGEMLEKAARALGGREPLLAARTLVIEGELRDLTALTPMPTGYGCVETDAPYAIKSGCEEVFTRVAFRQTVDLASPRWQIEESPHGTHVEMTRPRIYGLDGMFGFDATLGARQPAPDPEVALRQAAWYAHPITLIRTALDRSRLCCGRHFHEDIFEVGLDLTSERRGAATVTLNRNLPSGVSIDVGRDRVIEASFDDYRPVGNLMLPFYIRIFPGFSKRPGIFADTSRARPVSFADFVVDTARVE